VLLLGRVRIYTWVDHSVRLRARFVQQASFRCTGNCFFEASCATICLQPAVLTFVEGFFFIASYLPSLMGWYPVVWVYFLILSFLVIVS